MARDLIKGLIALMRPLNCFMAAVAVLAAFMFLAGPPGAFQKEIILGPLFVFFMCAAGNVFNDYMDVRVDRVNKPSRPIPSGMVTKKQALIFSFLLFFASVAIASQVSKAALVAALTGTLALFFYGGYSKSLGIFGNITVALIIGSPFIIIGMVTGQVHKSIFLAIAAATITFGRELVKSIEDVKGDSVIGRFSFPARYGKRKAMLAASASIIIGSVSLIYLGRFYGNIYALILLFALYKFSGSILQPIRMTPSKARKLSTDIKAGSALAIFALAAGSILA